ncbi:hypothetical protein NQ317_016864 [Molorchus minor]|uniref:Neuroendocrine protein 7B2 n=1 Tax=Molorchus minor TaxID=1323400 RepID=A0ABQ9ITW2_9CUCU|nr:hypothetical protein NQ317_016864 [Molorchus minor]
MHKNGDSKELKVTISQTRKHSNFTNVDMFWLYGVEDMAMKVVENFLSGIFLRDLVNRINGKGISEGDGVSYLDFTDGLPLDGRPLTRDLEEEQMFPLDYDSMGELNLHPSLRDQEYLQHSSLWGKQFVSGGAGEGSQFLRPEGLKNRQEIKTDSTLPAYCNPPNPCPVGYNEEQGASWILKIQHPTVVIIRVPRIACVTRNTCSTVQIPAESIVDDSMESMDFNRFLQQSMKMNQVFPHKNLVAKSFIPVRKSTNTNPFLTE